MTPREIANLIETHLPGSAQFPDDALHPRLETSAEHWRALAELLHQDDSLAFDWLSCITGLDYVAENQLAACYELRSTTHEHRLAVKVRVSRDEPILPTVCDLWPAADWHEREIYDLLGITFTNHPDMRRILLPDDWQGHPLRKDYEFPREYQGIPGSYELDWQQKPDYPS